MINAHGCGSHIILFLIFSILTFAAYNLPIDKCRFLSASVFYVYLFFYPGQVSALCLKIF